MDIQEAQADMRDAYFGGAPGVFVSGIMWLSAGITSLFASPQISILVFFFGGMLIHPLGIVLEKAMGRSGKHKKGNPLSNLAMESTLLLFIGLFIAYVVFQVRSDWFFPIMLTIIGGRYVVFASIYGRKVYWILGLALVLAGVGSLVLNSPFHFGAFLGGIIEVVFAIVIFSQEKSTKLTAS